MIDWPKLGVWTACVAFGIAWWVILVVELIP